MLSPCGAKFHEVDDEHGLRTWLSQTDTYLIVDVQIFIIEESLLSLTEKNSAATSMPGNPLLFGQFERLQVTTFEACAQRYG